LLFGALALRFFQPPGCGAKARFLFLQTHAEKLASRRLVGESVLQQCTLFNFFMQSFRKTVAEGLQKTTSLWYVRNSTQQIYSENLAIFIGTLVAPLSAKHESSAWIRNPDF
jgi:hypothetical protein